VLILAALLVLAAAPAAAGSSHGLKAEFEGPTFPPIHDPAEVAKRCPAGSEWIFGGVGEGTMTSSVYSGAFEYENTHCSRWIVFDPERTTGKYVGKADDGIFTMTTPRGDLEFAYEATWVFEGSLIGDPPPFTADIRVRYTIVGGTGDFEGATGSGRFYVTGGVYLEGAITGSLQIG
jgi:hypothetical protein